MIAFNGQYLDEASHGNMRITDACLGGQWVMGGWLKTATQQAIIAAFGREEGIAVIRRTNDYLNALALTDPTRAQQLAMFINEDPMLVCSLVETSKTRWLVGDGVAWINTGVKGNNPIDIQIDVMFESFTSSFSVLSARKSNYRFYACFIDSQKWCVPVGTDWTSVGAPVIKKSYRINTSFTSSAFTFAENGTQLYTGKGVSDTDLDMSLFARKYDNSIDSFAPSGTKVGGCILGTHNHLLPFTRNGENGMLDIISGTFHPNANTAGAFTIQITDKPLL